MAETQATVGAGIPGKVPVMFVVTSCSYLVDSGLEINIPKRCNRFSDWYVQLTYIALQLSLGLASWEFLRGFVWVPG